jgi:hypothetical protein
VRVLIDGCAQEAKYDPYYAHLAIQLCANDKKMKFTHHLAFWDLFKNIGRDRGQAQARRYNNQCLLPSFFYGLLSTAISVLDRDWGQPLLLQLFNFISVTNTTTDTIATIIAPQSL